MQRSYLLVTLIVLLISGCGGNRPDPEPVATPAQPVPEPPPPVQPERTGPVKIGLLLPLSGTAEPVGNAMLDAALMALFDVGSADAVLLPADTQSTTQGAVAAAQSVIAQDAEIILGPLFAASATAVRPIAAEAGIAVVAFSNDATIAGDGVYVAGFRPEEQVTRVVEYASRAGLFRIGAIAPEDAYGRRALGAWRGSIDPTSPGRSELYPPDQNAMALAIRRISDYDQRQAAKETELASLEGRQDAEAQSRIAELELLDTIGEVPLDALLIADGGSRLPSVAALMSYYDIDTQDVRLLGTMRWQEDLRALGEEALQGAWIASVWPADQDRFAKSYGELFGEPPHTLAGLAYDATAMAVVIGRSDRNFLDEQITDPAGFGGHAGIFRFLPSGVAEHGLAILEVADGTLRVLDPAPISFTSGIPTQ